MSAAPTIAPAPGAARGNRDGRAGRLGLRAFALGYLGLLLVLPVGAILYKTIDGGFVDAFASIATEEGWAAFYLTLLTVVIAVPINTILGTATAIVLVRHRFRGKAVLDALIDIPFAVSPVVIGLALVLLYGPRDSWFGPTLAELGIQVIFSPPGIVLACVFVSLPFVVREVVPVLEEIGEDAEQAAATLGATRLQTFWKITLPAIRWALIYGVVLSTARVLGEFGAVSVVSGRISGQTETLPLIVSKEFERLNPAGAYAAALVLAALALLTLAAMNLIKRKETD